MENEFEMAEEETEEVEEEPKEETSTVTYDGDLGFEMPELTMPGFEMDNVFGNSLL